MFHEHKEQGDNRVPLFNILIFEREVTLSHISIYSFDLSFL
jgi:hypothetical protein